MQSLDTIYSKMHPPLEGSVLSSFHPQTVPVELPREISRDVAHDLNNALMIIRGFTERLLMKNGEDSPLRADLQVIMNSAQRAEQVVRKASRKPTPPVGNQTP